jgi:type VI secretion system secreted protein Hcp
MAFQCYVTIRGHVQGTFQGTADLGATQTGANGQSGKLMRQTWGTHAGATGSNPGWIPVLAFNYEVTSPRDPATGLPSGKRQHMPVSFVKEWDDASPQLFEACCNNETLDSVRFKFVDADAKTSHTITLTNATISSMRCDIKGPAPPAAGTAQDLEEVALTFQKIEFVSGVRAASDTWTEDALSDTWTTDSPGVVTAGSQPNATGSRLGSIGTPPGLLTGGSVSNLVGAGAQRAAGAPGQTNVGGAGPPRFAPGLATAPIRGRLAGLNRPLQQGAPKTS